MKLLLPLVFLLLSDLLYCQVIPAGNRVDWTNAGPEAQEPQPSISINVMDYGAIPNDDLDDLNAVYDAMNSLNGEAGIVFFPAGKYHFSATLNLIDSLVLRGAGSDSTVLEFDFGNNGGDAIRIWKGQTDSFIDVTSGYEKGSSTLVVTDAIPFLPGSYAELKETNGVWDNEPASWAVDCVGQIVKIKEVHGDSLIIDEPLRINYEAYLQPEIRVYAPITNTGIECLKIIRTDSIAPSVAYNISFLGAADCWIKGVESDHSIGAHILADLSTHLLISGCYIHDAYAYDGVSTHGYGVTLIQHSGDCLIENNFFRHLRHAMMVKQGANGNVFAYNYSIEPTRTEFPTNGSGDISIHGHYPFANLFEGNIVQTIYVDQTWGPGGPYNTFFRNREDLYGIIVSQGNVSTDQSNFVGNEITNNGFLLGLYIISGNYNFLWGNNRQGDVDPAGTDSLADVSYYYSSLPSFWNGLSPYPPLGIPNLISSNSIPAKDRYINGESLTQCESVIATGSSQSGNSEINKGYPNPFSNVIYFFAAVNNLSLNPSFTLEDLSGRIVDVPSVKILSSNMYELHFHQDISAGCYLLLEHTLKGTTAMKMVRN